MTALRQIRQVVGATLFTCLSAVLAISVVWTFLTGGANPFVKIVPTPVPVPGKRTEMQGGMVFPRWGTTAYGSADKNYATGLTEIGKQTGARWLELTFNLWQDDTTATNIYRTDSTTTPANLAAGIRAAHAAGFKVFVVPELTLTSGEWCGEIKFSDPSLAKQWFTNYLQVLTPYLQAAATTGAEQFALGNEYENLEKQSPALWNTFIDGASALYPGALVYDFNFTSRWSLPHMAVACGSLPSPTCRSRQRPWP